jgi:hypothetical protein
MPDLSKLHGYFRCPCGAEFGGMTDLVQTERYCEAHTNGTGLIAPVLPRYAPGRLEMAQESFDEGVGLRIEKGLPVPDAILEDRKRRGLSLPEGWSNAEVEAQVDVSEEEKNGNAGSGKNDAGGSIVHDRPRKRSR